MNYTKNALENLKELNQYLAQFHSSHKSAYFERLIAEAFSNILYLPLYTIENDDTAVPYRVIWQGNIKHVSKSRLGKPDVIPNKAPPEKPDSIAYCYSFCLIIESTLKTGSNQCSQEFAQSIRHCQNFINQQRLKPNEIYIILVTPQIHQDTYRCIHSYARREYHFIPLETSVIIKLLYTSTLALTIRHVELRKLLNKVSKQIRIISSLSDFRDVVNSVIIEWQKEVFQMEKIAFIAIKSFETMQKIGIKTISVGEIFRHLIKDPLVNNYYKIISDKLSLEYLERSIAEFGFAVEVGHTSHDETLYELVPFEDFKERGLRLINALEKRNE